MKNRNQMDELDRIIEEKDIKIVFQPIVSLRDGSILGYEALSRVPGSGIKNPEMLFSAATQFNRLWDLEQLCRTKTLEAAGRFLLPPDETKLFLNVNPNTMRDEKFKSGFTKSFLRNYRIKPDNLIFEITERSMITDIEGFQESIRHYKNQDYKIAIDDAGAGYSGLNLISDINPNYIKLDMKLIRDVHSDQLKYALVKGMVELSKVSNIQLIAEGIEKIEELNALIHIGVQYGQGFFLQKPREEIDGIANHVVKTIKESNLRKNHMIQYSASGIHIKNLCNPTGVAAPADLVADVYQIFKNDLDCYGLCIIENGAPVGVVSRSRLALRLSGQYGFTLNQNKTIAEVMDLNFLSVDAKMPMNTVSTLAMARPNDKLYDFIVVTENGKYIGTVTIKDLLQKTIEVEVSEAKHQNPLTGLPGNLVIERELQACINGKKKFTAAYLDIDNFKAYNDVYGFENGDKVIKLLAEILRQSLTENKFVGHIGGDDFVIISQEHLKEKHFQAIITRFERESKSLYHERDVQNGYITATNREGETEVFPLMSLTCVSIDERTCEGQDVFELSARLATLKKETKHQKRELFSQKKGYGFTAQALVV